MKTQSLFFLFAAALASFATAEERQKPAPQLTAKEIAVVPFCSIALERKLDPKSKDIFDELKVSVTAGRQTRFRISGEKKKESGNLEGRPALHTGKLVLVPFADRKGTLTVKLPTVVDVRSYYMCVELAGDKLKSEYLKLEKGVAYSWSIGNADGQTVFQLLDDAQTAVSTIKVAEGDAKAFGFGATVRWKDNEADLTATIE